jgi:EpsI family protein
MTKRLFTVQCVLLAGFAAIFLLPHTGKSSPAGIAMVLPRVVGEWIGEDAAVTTKEREVLGKDTQFARKMYYDLAGDQIYVSIVLSGDDMTTSIHRPERCLPAQGWTVQESTKRNIDIPDGKSLEVTRLLDGQILRTKDNRQMMVHNLNYYWFIGYHNMTGSHLTRTGIDLRDRILYGENQRWAYVTVAANVTKGIARPERDQEETSTLIEGFIRDLMPLLQKPDGGKLL